MKIVVCIKQVPGTSQVEIDPETGVLKRDGAAAKINPYDLYALETAMRLKERCGGNVTAVTMGPSQADAMMKEAYMMELANAAQEKGVFYPPEPGGKDSFRGWKRYDKCRWYESRRIWCYKKLCCFHGMRDAKR